MGKLSVLQYGIERARLGKPPFPVGYDSFGNKVTSVATIGEFVQRANEILMANEASLRHVASA
jgi:hypothetical protein